MKHALVGNRAQLLARSPAILLAVVLAASLAASAQADLARAQRLVGEALEMLQGQRIDDAVDSLIERGCDALVLGCTELPLAIPERERNGRPVVDASEVLARALVRAVAPDRLIDSD